MIKINNIVTKSPDWKVADLTNEAGAFFKDVSINKVSKKGEPFPNFDTLAVGQDIDGILWTSDSGKNYLFPPKAPSQSPQNVRGATFKAKMIEDTMNKKQEYIQHSQENKELGIKISSTMRMAVDITIAEGKPNPENILRWRKWLWENWNASDTDFAPFPDKSVKKEMTPDQEYDNNYPTDGPIPF